MASMMADLEQWMDEAFGPLDANPRITDLDMTEPDLSPDNDFIPMDQQLSVADGRFSTTDSFLGNNSGPIESTVSFLPREPSTSKELSVAKQRYSASHVCVY